MTEDFSGSLKAIMSPAFVGFLRFDRYQIADTNCRLHTAASDNQGFIASDWRNEHNKSYC